MIIIIACIFRVHDTLTTTRRNYVLMIIAVSANHRCNDLKGKAISGQRIIMAVLLVLLLYNHQLEKTLF